MRIEKKTIVKEDGRLLTYYHFPETATPEQNEAFRSAPAETQSAGPPADRSESVKPGTEGNDRV